MLTSKEAADALITNLKNWEWKLNNDKYVIDRSTGEKLIEEYEKLKKDNAAMKKILEEGEHETPDLDCALRD